eukprot:Skav235764  [mRNA]  locus=scaffold803:540950:547686:- [translate_table: standard]
MHSTRAEREALLWGGLWRVNLNVEVATAFLTDSASGLMSANGDAGGSSDESTSLLRSVYQSLGSCLPDDLLRIEHTRSHSGHFWNELADRLAGKVRLDPSAFPAPAPPCPRWKQLTVHIPTLMQRDWTFLDPDKDALCFCHPDPPMAAPADTPQQDCSTSHEIHIDLCVATANVMSLFSSEAGGTGKVSYLQAQFDSVGLHIVGIQEARGQAGTFESDSWLRFATSCDRGQLGVELWLSKKTPYAKGPHGPIRFGRSHVAVVDASPRHLLARLDAPGLHTWILVGHAPHNGAPEDVRQTWWANLASDATLQRQHDGLLPVLQAEGPRRPVRQPDGAELFALQDRESLLDAFFEEMTEDASPSPLEARLRRVILARPWSWSRCCDALWRLASDITPDDAAAAGETLDFIRDTLYALASPEAWPFLETVDDEPLKFKDVPTEQWTGHLRAHLAVAEQTSGLHIPRAFSRDRVVLHFFSGRRRFGDLQDFMERFPCGDSTVLHVISLDLVFDTQWADLANPSTQIWWLECIKARWVVAMLAGPPCCTWSQARGKVVEGRKRAPRIIRTAAQPWGLDLLAVRELLQLLEGNVLLMFCVEALFELWTVGGAGILEHPATPDDSAKASVWRTAPLQFLQSLDGFRLVTVWQGLYGAKSPKPTQLLVLNMPLFHEHLRMDALTTQMPQQISIGINKAGEWATTGLKEYPPCLNRSMARSMMDFISQAPVSPDIQPSPLFWRTVEPMQASYGHQMGKDFHG